MACMFQISVSRVLSPEEGQSALAQMMTQIQHQGAVAGGIGYLPPAAGVHVGENPFPEWLTQRLMANIPNLLFDDVNFFFYRTFETLEEAQHYERWVRGTLTGWARHDPEKLATMNTLQTRTMRDYAGQVPAGDVDVF